MPVREKRPRNFDPDEEADDDTGDEPEVTFEEPVQESPPKKKEKLLAGEDKETVRKKEEKEEAKPPAKPPAKLRMPWMELGNRLFKKKVE